SLDEMLTNITLYWVTGANGYSFWPYCTLRHGAWPIPVIAKITVPTGYVEFPREIMRPPRSVEECVCTDIKRGLSCPKTATSPHLSSPGPWRWRSGCSSNHCGATEAWERNFWKAFRL